MAKPATSLLPPRRTSGTWILRDCNWRGVSRSIRRTSVFAISNDNFKRARADGAAALRILPARRFRPTSPAVRAAQRVVLARAARRIVARAEHQHTGARDEWLVAFPRFGESGGVAFPALGHTFFS